MLLFDSPAALAEEVGDEVFELAFDSRARWVRVGEQRGHDFTLAALIIVAVVIIMAVVKKEVKAEPVFLPWRRPDTAAASHVSRG